MIKETIKHIYIWQQQRKWVPHYCNYRPSILETILAYIGREKKCFQESRHAAQMPPQIWESPFWLSTNHIIHRFSSWPSSQARSVARYPDDHRLQGNLRVLLCRAQTLALKDGLIRENIMFGWTGKEAMGGGVICSPVAKAL